MLDETHLIGQPQEFDKRVGKRTVLPLFAVTMCVRCCRGVGVFVTKRRHGLRIDNIRCDGDRNCIAWQLSCVGGKHNAYCEHRQFHDCAS